MWNPFSRVTLKAILPAKETKPASGSNDDPIIKAEIEQMQLRSLLARTQIVMIHETLAERALLQIRGGAK